MLLRSAVCNHTAPSRNRTRWVIPSPDASTWTTIRTNHSNYSGYTLAAGKFVDVQSLPATTAEVIRARA